MFGGGTRAEITLFLRRSHGDIDVKYSEHILSAVKSMKMSRRCKFEAVSGMQTTSVCKRCLQTRVRMVKDGREAVVAG